LKRCAEPLGRPVLISAEFAASINDTGRLEALGHYNLRGVREAKEIFAWTAANPRS